MGCQCDDRPINSVQFGGLKLLDVGLYTSHYLREMVCFVGVTESDHASCSGRGESMCTVTLLTLAACFQRKIKAAA